MLVEINCDKFLQNRIKFNDGLNVVLGGAKANNSIGKSTLLLVIDYCFGGDTYCKKQDCDIIKNVGHHIIRFTFRFGNELYRFARDTSNPNYVGKCNENNEIFEEISLKEFNEFLNKHYFPNNSNFSFRDKVGRFIRVAGKDNIHEDKPLKGFGVDSDNQGINVLEELFHFYKDLKEIKEKLKQLKDEKKARDLAKKFNFIPQKIKSKNDYKVALAERSALLNEREEIFKQGNIRHFEGDAAFSRQAIDLKIQLENLLKNQSRLSYRKKKLDKSIISNNSISDSELNELHTFFPNVNIKKLDEINEFHKGIIAIVTNEIMSELALINEELEGLSNKIKPIEKELNDLNIPNCISPDVMKAAAQKEAEIISVNNCIESYKKDLEMRLTIRETKTNLEESESKIAEKVSNSINKEMEIISNKINIEKRYSPKFIIKNNDKYQFETPNDTGTGSKYKGLIIFDLSVLNLSSLPILVHDSILFKNIADDPINNIFKQYILSNKQIFVSVDKIGSYHNKGTASIINSKTVIKLDDGLELFGKSWGKISN